MGIFHICEPFWKTKYANTGKNELKHTPPYSEDAGFEMLDFDSWIGHTCKYLSIFTKVLIVTIYDLFHPLK